MSRLPSRVSIIGDGAMGTLCALILCEKGLSVTLWGRDPQCIAEFSKSRENRRYLPGFRLSESVHITSDPGQATAGAQFIVCAVPCQYIGSVFKRLALEAAGSSSSVPLVSVTKGIEVKSLRTPTQLLRVVCGLETPVAALSGPCIGREAANRLPASVVVASEDPSLAKMVQETFCTNYFRTYVSRDLVGVELAGAVKNVIAIAAGICDGIGAGENAKAALITRGVVEITRLGLAMGAEEKTFYGLAGVGDLITTCASRIGRNRCAGERIGQGATTEQVLKETPSVIEGIPTTKSVLELAGQYNVEMPIVSAVASVLFNRVKPEDAIDSLMTRPLGCE